MDRRLFLETLGVASAAAQSTQKMRTEFYLLENYYLRHSTQMARIHEFMSRGLLPAVSESHAGPKIFLEGLVAAHLPQYAAILGFGSLEEVAQWRAGRQKNDALRKAYRAWEDGPEPPYEHYSETLLKAADYSPEVQAGQPSKTPRVFELRVYHSPTWKQLAALHDRFAGPEIKIFHRVGVRPILYTETYIGANMPNLTYLTPFDNLAAREKAWEAFGSDPEWIKVRKESVDAYGQIASVIQISLFKAAPYSPVR
ncbi:MAG: NIPSNAP family protein [Bryobacteraceae bacterium]